MSSSPKVAKIENSRAIAQNHISMTLTYLLHQGLPEKPRGRGVQKGQEQGFSFDLCSLTPATFRYQAWTTLLGWWLCFPIILSLGPSSELGLGKYVQKLLASWGGPTLLQMKGRSFLAPSVILLSLSMSPGVCPLGRVPSPGKAPIRKGGWKTGSSSTGPASGLSLIHI